MSEQIKVTFTNQETIEVKKGISLQALASARQSLYDTPIVVAKIKNTLKELYTTLEEDTTDLELIDLHNKDGIRVYQRSATFLLIAAAKKVLPEAKVLVNHHITGGYFCEFDQEVFCTEENLKKIEEKMQEMVKAKLPIEKSIITVDDALKMFDKEGLYDKAALFKYRRTSWLNLYTLDGVKDYFYGYMMPNTENISLFKLVPYAHGFILLFPDEQNPNKVSLFKPQPKLSEVFRESEKWARILEIDIVAALNDTISQDRLQELIYICEALHEKKIANIADEILKRKQTRLVLIAGPSSSGKTTFAKRLGVQLRVNGLKPHVISIDDYFVNRELTPVDENGDYDFEALESIDVELFNDHINRLIKGEEVEIPSFNFKSGEREYKGNRLKIGPEEVLVVEGIHGLNEKLSYAVPKENKYKVYISCLTQLNIDHHNRIPTTDTRLLRRMVRDHAYRGFSAEWTLELWDSVRRGENRNIFPYQEEADSMFNSMLIYELAMLKPKAEPLLFNISRTSPYYNEAKRLLKFLEYFLPADTADIPCNSIIREFVGGSSFR